MALTYDQITAITEKYYLKKLVNNVYKVNAALARMTRPNMFKKIDGGEKLIAPIISSKASEGGYYSGFDTLGSNPTDNISAAEFDWKQIQEPIRVSRLEMLKNNGDAKKLSLIEGKTMVAEKAIRDNLSIGLFSDGTAATGASTTKQLTGFQALMSESSTYGGIAVADLDEWKANVLENSSVDRALSLSLMQQAFGEASDGTETPTVGYCRQNVYDQSWALFQPHQRLMNEEMAGLGFKNVLEFNGIPLIVDSHMPAKTIYFINENFSFLGIHKDENMRRQTFEKLETSDNMLIRIFWAGNLMCNQRRRHSSLEDIEVAS